MSGPCGSQPRCDGLHYVLHAPQGDTYADLLFTMIERRDARPPVTYTTFQARDLGGDTAELFKTATRDAYERFQPQAMIVGASCTAELIQDDPGGLAAALNLPIPVIPLELPAYQKKENWGAAETFYRLVRSIAGARRERGPHARPICNILGPTALGFRHRDDLREISGLLDRLGVEVGVTAPLGATPSDLTRLGEADFNVVLYPEIALSSVQWLEKAHGQPFTRIVPVGVGATREFITEVARLAGVDATKVLAAETSRLPWYSRSVNSTYLTGKWVFIFGDATHAVAAARIAQNELGFRVVGLGTYSREFAREVREAAKRYDAEALITDDYLDVEATGRRAAAGARSRHADGAPYRQAARHSLRRHLRACARPGFSRPLLAANGLRRRQRDLRRLDPSADDGARGASALDVPRGLRIWERRRALASGRRDRRRAGADSGRRAPAARRGNAEARRIPGAAVRGRGGLGVDVGRRTGVEENPVLCPRQGPPQHRALRDGARRGANHHRDALRCKSPFHALRRLPSES